ncbi:hypothetical protein BZG29_12005 [Janthinobacterium sp. LM6]|uniref:type VI secretion system baseplate subunit TssF n=1 Tax=Janthinobacterium sp. LM6 TaxID=1938606 RepID=UPI00098407B9|nr:type VI secretion system baseplate subunit TssF [Janthinobacterium sp. LM6]AQR68982.1 hypothetical protein BZG29_12005 [Janthinobacterium sp. LM6]
MESLLKYYELELGMLRTHQQEFAARYPGVAAALGIVGSNCHDPHIERLIEAYALCNARTAKKIDDARHVFTESMLEVNFPHYLRPFPACSSVVRWACRQLCVVQSALQRGERQYGGELDVVEPEGGRRRHGPPDGRGAPNNGRPRKSTRP